MSRSFIFYQSSSVNPVFFSETDSAAGHVHNCVHALRRWGPSVIFNCCSPSLQLPKYHLSHARFIIFRNKKPWNSNRIIQNQPKNKTTSFVETMLFLTVFKNIHSEQMLRVFLWFYFVNWCWLSPGLFDAPCTCGKLWGVFVDSRQVWFRSTNQISVFVSLTNHSSLNWFINNNCC